MTAITTYFAVRVITNMVLIRPNYCKILFLSRSAWAF